MKFDKVNLSAILIGIVVIIFVVPFLFYKNNDVVAVLSTSFTAVGAFATIFTAVIAIAIYDKFGIDQKLASKQVDKVLELIDVLKGKLINVEVKMDGYKGGLHYNLRPSREHLKSLKLMHSWQADKEKKVACNDQDYSDGLEILMKIKRSYWIPKEIKDKMEFLEFPMFQQLDQNDLDKFAIIDMRTKVTGEISLLCPEMTFFQFVENLFNLVLAIETWIENNTSIKIDIRLDEAEFNN